MTANGVISQLVIFESASLFLASVASSAVLIKLLHPLLVRYALVRPNFRSSHTIPTPQGAGIAVVVTTTALAALANYYVSKSSGDTSGISWVLFAAILIAAVGALDDLLALNVAPRILIQAAAVAIVIYAMPSDLRIVPVIPWWLERALLLIGSLWFVNVVNFMDGIDWMTVAEVLPITGGLILAGALGQLPLDTTIVAITLLGGIIGFAPYNKPVARLFLGDVGSLPIGLLLGWMLILLAGHGHLAAAILLPLYYLADASITLGQRMVRRESILTAHRSHFYQRATALGFSVREIVARVFIVNIALVALAMLTILIPGALCNVIALVTGTVLVGWLLMTLARGKR